MQVYVLLFSVLDERDGTVIKKFILFTFDFILSRMYFRECSRISGGRVKSNRANLQIDLTVILLNYYRK